MQEEIREKLRIVISKLEHLKICLDVDVKKQEIEALEASMMQPGFWEEQVVSKKIVKELKRLKNQVGPWDDYMSKAQEALELLTIIGDDEELAESVLKEVLAINMGVEKLEFHTLLGGEFDSNDAILSINAGAGGTESCDWTDMLLRMYTRWAERRGYAVKIMDILQGEEAGVKNASLSIKGDFAYGYLKSETGVHRLVRISPFDSNKRRHTSFASVDVIAQIQDDVTIEIKPDELRIDTYRASGSGGQHVNVTDSAVRITHLPTGIVTQCQNERSQHQNKEVCMSFLRAKLYELKRKEQEDKVSKEYGQKQKIEWGSQIRSYVMHPYNMVKDHRTSFETGNVDAVMDGDLDDFIHAYLNHKAGEKRGKVA